MLFGAVKLNENAGFDKYSYSECGVGFDAQSFSLSDSSGFGENVKIFHADMSSSVYTGYKKKDTLILGKGPTNGLDDTTLTAKKEYSTNFTEQQTKCCLSL